MTVESTLRDRLEDLAYNLRWEWHDATRSLFESLDPELWERTGQNPVALLRRLGPEVDPRAESRSAEIDRLWSELRDYVAGGDRWYAAGDEPADRPLAAYFSAEYGLTACLRIYSGGLGVLAGDHLKSASDLGVPLVAVGLLYREGYFNQRVDAAGRQTEEYPIADLADLPIRAVGEDDAPLRVAVPFPGRQVLARVWRADVGRVPLFLLDTDLPENADADRALTGRLYGGDQEMRISQEIILGIGGCRALREMGVRPRAYHMNEGHSAFLSLELIRQTRDAGGLDFEEAAETVRARTVFTTHTPVPAGHDRFPPDLVLEYVMPYARALGLSESEFLGLGRVDAADDEEPFTMTVLALRLAEQVNGVSELHGSVTRSMWHALWPELDLDQVPIGHITNGVHMPSWIHADIAAAAGIVPVELGVNGPAPAPDPASLWSVRTARRARLVDWIRHRTGDRLDPDALTVAFARRFATYKRATLLLSDLDRLEALLCDDARPVQIVYAGKAHPRDEGGKALIREIVERSRDPRFRDRIAFIPAYGIDVARELVQGADVWLNNPRRPMEASGTSGMKAAANGVLNASILDGWWDEAYRSAREAGAAIGWAIGAGEEPETVEEADAADAAALFEVLESEIVPLFYQRDEAGLPRDWVERTAASIRQVAPAISSHRMVREYVDRYRRAAAASGAATVR